MHGVVPHQGATRQTRRRVHVATARSSRVSGAPFAAVRACFWTWPLAFGVVLAGAGGCEEAGSGPGPTAPAPPPTANRAPQAVGSISPQTVGEGQSAAVDVAAHFRDPDGDTLNYGAASADVAVATVETMGGSVTVTAAGLGKTTVTITATDPGGLATTLEFAVTVASLAQTVFDPLVSQFMEQHDITAGAIGFSQDGEIGYEQVFGWMDQERSIPVPDDVMMRIMSVSKPFTAAAIHELERSGQLELDRFAFDLGQPDGGVLQLDPFPSLGDPRMAEITVRHLLLHRAGWDRNIARTSWQNGLKIAEAMSVPSPPGPRNTLRYILGQPLVFDPGSRRAYSNEGYLVLQTIIEEASGQDYMDYLFRHVLAPLGIHSDNVIRAGTLPGDRSPREPWYDATNSPSLGRNVFDPSGPLVHWPDGRWDVGGSVGVGGLVATPRAILTFLDAYVVAGDDIGMRRRRVEEPDTWRLSHTGGSTGSSALARQRGDGIDFVVLFNRRDSDADYHRAIGDQIDEILDGTAIRWPE